MTPYDDPPECLAAREAVSAALDGEDPGLPADWTNRHLVDCPACRMWYDRARALRRRTRLTVVPQVPDLTDRILRAGTTAGRRRRRPRRHLGTAVRCLLVVVAGLQLWSAAPMLLLGHDHDAGTHPAHELGSFGVALAVGLLYAAWRPPAARAMRPLVGTASVLLLGTATLDILHGHHATLTGEAPHLLSLAGFLLLCLLPGRRDANAQAQIGPPADPGLPGPTQEPVGEADGDETPPPPPSESATNGERRFTA